MSWFFHHCERFQVMSRCQTTGRWKMLKEFSRYRTETETRRWFFGLLPFTTCKFVAEYDSLDDTRTAAVRYAKEMRLGSPEHVDVCVEEVGERQYRIPIAIRVWHNDQWFDFPTVINPPGD